LILRVVPSFRSDPGIGEEEKEKEKEKEKAEKREEEEKDENVERKIIIPSPDLDPF